MHVILGAISDWELWNNDRFSPFAVSNKLTMRRYWARKIFTDQTRTILADCLELRTSKRPFFSSSRSVSCLYSSLLYDLLASSSRRSGHFEARSLCLHGF